MNGAKSILTLGLSMMFAAANYLPVLAESKPVTSQEYVKNNKSDQNSLPVVGVINDKNLSSCGGSFQFVKDHNNRSQKWIFISLLVERNAAFMNFNGNDVKLSLVNQKKGKNDLLITETYSYKNLRIRLDYSLFAPPSAATGYEASIYNAKMTISRGKNSKVLRLRGYVGC